jgi:sugar (pentulose or hexulose) kinase
MSAIVVLDVGKTLSKLSLWTEDGALIERRTRTNQRAFIGDMPSLDVARIEAWLAETLTSFAALAPVRAIVPVGHGAAAVIVSGGQVLAAVDYETPAPQHLRDAYDLQRDPFAETGSPPLPNCLNLGFQLHLLEAVKPGVLQDSVVISWPQYWAWLLSGVAATERSSLGCHTDLWRPIEDRPSMLAQRRGWADRFAPLRWAGDVLGPIRPEWAMRTRLPPSAAVYCGLHDSNAALLAARAHAEISGVEATVVSTGTWFVAMRTAAEGAQVDAAHLPEGRDCLINVDIAGRPIPSARFMGGRDIQLLLGSEVGRIDAPTEQAAILSAVARVAASGAMATPTLTPGVGAFPTARGGWRSQPQNSDERCAAACLYAALMTDAMLDLIGARGTLVVEGRFAAATAFVSALAELRPGDRVYSSNAGSDVSFGALRLAANAVRPATELAPVSPLGIALGAYRTKWRGLLDPT